MKNVILLIACTLYLSGAYAQSEKLIGKWNIFEMSADGETYPIDKLKEFGKDKDYIEILEGGALKMFDDNIILNGSWEYNKEENILTVVLQPSAEAKERGEGESSMKYTVEDVTEEFLVLKLGSIMTSKYKKANKN